jgi:hypothetical protein
MNLSQTFHLGFAHVHGAVRLLAVMVLGRPGERRGFTAKGGRSQSDAEQVPGSHLLSRNVMSGRGAEGCAADEMPSGAGAVKFMPTMPADGG